MTRKVKYIVRPRRIFGYRFHVLHGSYGWEIQIGPHYWIRQYGTLKIVKHYDPYGKKVWGFRHKDY